MKLPPFSGENEAMYQWSVEQFTPLIENGLLWDPEHTDDPIRRAWLESDEPAKQKARMGDMTLLRQRYPHLAEFLHPPKYGRGEHPRPIDDNEILAVELVRRVRANWQWHYQRQNRHRGDITAEEIVARYLDVDVDKVLRWVAKNYGPGQMTSPRRLERCQS